MTQPTPTRAIPNQAGDINERLLRRFGVANNLGRIESAHRKLNTSLYSPEGKRSFMRMFHPMQVNVHFVTTIAPLELPEEDVALEEDNLKKMLATATDTMDRGVARIEKKLTANNITALAEYGIPPVTQDVPVFSGLGRRYLELIVRFDHLMLMIETLAVDDAITHNEAARLKSEFKKTIRSVAQAARLTSNRLRRSFRERNNVPATGANGDDQLDLEGDVNVESQGGRSLAAAQDEEAHSDTTDAMSLPDDMAGAQKAA